MKRILAIPGFIVVLIAAFSFMVNQEDPWKVPEKYKKMTNPVLADEASINSGHEIYGAYCVSCHGKQGKGNGIRSTKLNTPPADFTSAVFQMQTDGELLYKIYSGHRNMPGFSKKIPGNKNALEGGFGNTRMPGDLVNYIRNFSNK
jgi:mono/diheme cytochrome c family protein